MISQRIHMRLNTILVGDPNDMPVIKANSSFGDDSMLSGHSASPDPTTNFFMAIKNVGLDTTDFDKDSSLIALDWSTSQACQLSNVNISMPFDSSGHTGISMHGGSSTIVSDVVRLLLFVTVKQLC